MKRLRILSVFMVLFTVLGGMVSCETEPVDPLLLTDDNGGTDTIVDPGVFTVKIGGTLFVSDSTIATLSNGAITIKGYKGTSGENVTIVVPTTTLGTYTAQMSYNPGTSLGIYTNLNPETSELIGTATITTINTAARVISGRFNFTGFYSDRSQNLPNVAFTEGLFTNISYAGGTTNPNPGAGIFKADVDGAPFTALTTTAVLGSGRLTIQGVDATGKSIDITAEDTTPGTYTEVILAYSADATSDNAYSNIFNDTGTLTITSIDTVNRTITGTFSFKGDYTDTDANLPSKMITNGVFTNLPYVGSVANTDVFNATVDTTAVSYAGSDLLIVYSEAGGRDLVAMRGTNENHVIELLVDGDTEVGTYAFTDSTTGYPRAQYTDKTGPDDVIYNVTGGSLTVTENNGVRIKGTFEFPVRSGDSIIYTITAGAFDIEL